MLVRDSGNYYLEGLTGQVFSYTRGQFSLQGSSGSSSSVVFLISPDGLTVAEGAYRNMLHLVFAQSAVLLDVYLDGVPTNIFSTVVDLETDGTVYPCGVRQTSPTSVTIEMPDGSEQVVSDASLNMTWRYLEIEGFVLAPQDVEPAWHEVRAG